MIPRTWSFPASSSPRCPGCVCIPVGGDTSSAFGFAATASSFGFTSGGAALPAPLAFSSSAGASFSFATGASTPPSGGLGASAFFGASPSPPAAFHKRSAAPFFFASCPAAAGFFFFPCALGGTGATAAFFFFSGAGWGGFGTTGFGFGFGRGGARTSSSNPLLDGYCQSMTARPRIVIVSPWVRSISDSCTRHAMTACPHTSLPHAVLPRLTGFAYRGCAAYDTDGDMYTVGFPPEPHASVAGRKPPWRMSGIVAALVPW
mmetsp:Transcript_39323/g.121601  ORF Transcript_39323/g.121601 Transcript_39323/m.121601 type:complete len:261 (-) Transcript_39323:295-1077(-)